MDPPPPPPSWSDLQTELLLDIARRLHSRFDRLRFRAVCHSWRSLLPPPDRTSLPSSPPLRLPFPMGPNPNMDPNRRGYFKLVESTVYFLQPLKKISDPWKTSKCWLLRIEESENNLGKVRLIDTLVGIAFRNLSPPLPEALNLLDYKISEVTKVHRLRYEDNKKVVQLNVKEIKSIYATKLAVCYEGPTFAVMAVHTAGQLSFWKTGNKKWTRILYGREGAQYDDVVFHKGKFYAVDSAGLTIMIDLELNISLVAPAISLSGYDENGYQIKHLVRCLDGLFLLDKTLVLGPEFDSDSDGEYDFSRGGDDDDDCVNTSFQVYKLNEEMQQWVEVKSLEDRVVFVGNMECVFSASAKEFPGCKKNCIYFEQPSLKVKIDRPGYSAALFDMEECSAILGDLFLLDKNLGLDFDSDGEIYDSSSDDYIVFLQAKEFPGCKRNCIYFDNLSLDTDCDHPGFNAALFDVEDCSATFVDVFHGSSRSSFLAVVGGFLLTCIASFASSSLFSMAPPSWSDLETELLLDIAGRLHSRFDRLRFRAVCHSWRSILPLPDRSSLPASLPLLPFPMAPSPYIHPRRRGHFRLVESTVYILQPLKKISDPWKTSKCWLIRIEDSENVGKVCLLDPLIGFTLGDLSPRLPESLNLLDYKISEVTKLYRLEFGEITCGLAYHVNEIKSTYASKVALCYEGGAFAIMALHSSGQLSFWKMGDKEWTRIDDDRHGVHYDDVLYRKGKFYAVESSGFTVMIDLSLNISQVAPAISLSAYDEAAISLSAYDEDGEQRKHLVNCLDDLFLLDKNLGLDDFDSDGDDDCVSGYFQVYKLNEEMQKWIQVKSLEDRVIFVGNVECIFSVSAKEFPGCKKNCIYFDQPSLDMKCDHPPSFAAKCDHPGFSAALFDMEESSASVLSAVYGYSGLFWPPPPWIIPHASSSSRR
ncbi:F-box protein SKIP23-like [Senna tora]|uniref:F-box protein SKIP23-like n=1 Tax=Senna tora TaxID=362788 RepID=A0A834U2Z0_9FABA|nr:F-box protein SKIP23-like [Senna tora]